jgi:GTPase SAR1 family protein
LLVFSITDAGSFKEVIYWYDELRKHNRACHCVLIGNKSDLERERAVTREMATQLAKNRLEGCPYYETSCKDGAGVIEAFLNAADMGARQMNTPGAY